MTRTEALVRAVLGSSVKNVRTFVAAIDKAIEKSFACKRSIDDIQVTKVIYPEVANQLGKTSGAVSRQVGRIANACWEQGDRDRLNEIVGYELPCRPPPKELLFHFAAFSFYGVSYREVINQRLAKLF